MVSLVLKPMTPNQGLIPDLTRNVKLINQFGIFWAVPKKYLSCGPSPVPAPQPEEANTHAIPSCPLSRKRWPDLKLILSFLAKSSLAPPFFL